MPTSNIKTYWSFHNGIGNIHFHAFIIFHNKKILEQNSGFKPLPYDNIRALTTQILHIAGLSYQPAKGVYSACHLFVEQLNRQMYILQQPQQLPLP